MTQYVQYPANTLPLTLIDLNDWVCVDVKGADSKTYLQGQVTADVVHQIDSTPLLCGHCDAKGKMWSNLYLFKRGEELAYLVRRSVSEKQLSEIKKYAVFSKVTFSLDESAQLLALAGQGARSALSELFSQLPDENSRQIQVGNSTLIFLSQPEERFLIITDSDEKSRIQSALADAQTASDAQWLALDIEAGFAVIDLQNNNQLLPQATNLQSVENGISFNKGCYSGQEMVARAKYRGANKRAMYSLVGVASQLPIAGDDIEMQLGENWRRTGLVLSAVRFSDNKVLIQAVLSNDLDMNTAFRVRDDENSQLALQKMPYSLDEE